MTMSQPEMEQMLRRHDNDISDIYLMMSEVQGVQRFHTGQLRKIEGRLDGIDGRLDSMDARFDGIDGRLDGIDGRLDSMDGRLDSILEILLRPET